MVLYRVPISFTFHTTSKKYKWTKTMPLGSWKRIECVQSNILTMFFNTIPEIFPHSWGESYKSLASDVPRMSSIIRSYPIGMRSRLIASKRELKKTMNVKSLSISHTLGATNDVVLDHDTGKKRRDSANGRRRKNGEKASGEKDKNTRWEVLFLTGETREFSWSNEQVFLTDLVPQRPARPSLDHDGSALFNSIHYSKMYVYRGSAFSTFVLDLLLMACRRANPLRFSVGFRIYLANSQDQGVRQPLNLAEIAIQSTPTYKTYDMYNHA